MKKIITIQYLAIVCICCQALVYAGTSSSTNYQLQRYVKPMSGNLSNSENYDTKSTTGQPVIGFMSYGTLVIEAGYWAKANTNPYDITLSVSSVAENNVAGLSIATLSSSDYDTSDFHSYSLVSGPGDSDNASFTINGSELIANVVFDYETKSSYSIRVRSNDNNYGSYETIIIIQITDINDPPTVEMSISNQEVDEFSEFYLNLDSSMFNDTDSGDSLTYTASLSDGNPLPEWLLFNPTTLILMGTPIQNDIGSIEIKLIATDNASSSIENTFTITISDSIDNLPMRSTNYQMPRYVAPMGGILSESPHFQKKSSTGQDAIGIQTMTTKQLKAGYWAKANSNPVNLTLSSTTIAENNMFGLSIATISTVDYDADDTHSYSLVSGEGDTDNAIFEIDGTNLIANVVFDYETKNSYSIRIRATDNNYGWIESIFIIQIADRNDAPDISSISNQSIDEDTASDAISFTVTDADSISLTLSGYSSDISLIPIENIVINGSGSIRTVVITPTTNANGSATITLSVSDGAYTASTSFDVTVTSINDPPTVAMSISNQDVDEFAEFYLNLDPSYFNDVDISDSLSYTATLSDGNPLPQWLSFDPSTLVFIGTPIQDHIGTIEIKLIATDNSSSSIENIFSISINDAVDNLPMRSTNFQMPRYVAPMGGIISESLNYQKKASTGQDVIGIQTMTKQLKAGYWAKANSNPTNITLSYSTISENNVAGLSIATISSLDYDYSDSPAYSLVSGDGDTDNALFMIDGANLIANEVFDFETKTSYSIRIRATDCYYGWSETIFLIQVADINETPEISASISDQTINEDEISNAITFTATDAETSPCSLSISITSSDQTLLPDFGISYTCNDNNYTITATPAANKNGVVTITFLITDSGGLTATTSFALTVTAVNDIPIISTISDQTTLEDIAISAIGFTIADAETDASSLTVSALSSNLTPVTIENIVFNGTGENRTISITPTANEYGFVTISIAVTDGDLTSTTAFEITVTSVNDMPEISNIADQIIDEDTVTNAIRFTISDADGDNLTLSINSSNLTLVALENISFSGTGGDHAIRITPTANEYGLMTITVSVTDGSLTASTSFALTVNSINDMPVFSAIDAQTTNEDISITTINFSITDIENVPCSMNITLTSSNQTLLPDANLTYICSEDSYTITASPNLNQNGIVLISILVEDSGGLTSSTSFDLTVASMNDTPVLSDISGQTINEDTVLNAVSITFADADGDNLTLSANSSDLTLVSIEHISFSGTTGSGATLLVTPTINEFGDVTITIAITDGSLTTTSSFALTVVSVNDIPILSAIDNQTTAEDTAINSINFTITDIEDAPCSMSISLTSQDQNIMPDANLSYVCNDDQYTITAIPALNQNGSVGITVTVEDSGGLTSVSGFILSITPVNDAPIVSNILNQSTDEDTVTNAIAFTVTDFDGDSLTLSVNSSNLSRVAIENITLSGTGSSRTITIAPTSNEYGAVSITISVSDGALTSVTTFEMTIDPVNDAPTVTANISNQIVDEYAPFSLVLNAGTLFSDIDTGDSLTYTATLSDNNPLPQWLSFDSSTQTFSGIPLGQNVGTIDIKVTATDSFSASIDNLFSITINDTNSNGFLIRSLNYRSTRYVIPMGGCISTSTQYKHKTTSGQDVIGWTTKDLKTAKIGYWPKANSNPYDITLTNAAVAENNVSALTVGSIVSSDYDYDDPHTYTLVSGTGDIDNGIFILNGITITTNELFDYENKPDYSIRVRVFDSNYGWADKVIIIHVIDLNELPHMSASISDHTIDEDARADAIAFTVTDPESAPCDMSISITSSNTILFPSNSFSYTCNDNNYTITAAPALNKYGLATITITLTDAGGLTASNSFDLTVTSIEDAPVISSIPDQSIFEDAVSNAIAFTVTDAESDPMDLTVSAISSNLTLVAIENIAISFTAKTITITPTANEFGSVTITIAATDGGLTSTRSFALSVTPVNDIPVLSTILDQTIDEDTAINSISFTTTDIEDSPCSLSISITSSNQNLIPEANISSTCNDNNYTMTANPVLNQNGSTIITITVTDSGGLTAITAFELTVISINDSPVISNISDQIIDEDCATSPLSFSITDVDFDSLTVTTQSSIVTLVSEENIEISGTGENRTITILPKVNAFGSAIISISVTDGMLTDTSSFNLTVNAVNDMPLISEISNHTTNELTSYQINYTVTDIESTNLTVTAMSQKSTLIPQNNLTISNTGENYTLSITPVMAEAGTTSITITISDGENITETVFMFTVETVLLNVSGYVGYYHDVGSQPVSNVAISLSGKYDYSATTDNFGNYTLASVRPGNYTQTIEKSDISSGIDISDAINILKSTVSLQTFTCEQIIAGDTNMNESVTPLDAVKISRYVAGMISYFNDNNTRWRFIPEMVADCYSWPPIPFSNTSNLLITTDMSDQNFIGILLGDVDGNWEP